MTIKDWTGNSKSTYGALGANNHTDSEREEHDFYATDPIAIDGLLSLNILSKWDSILEPSCGQGHMSKALEAKGFTVFSSDLIDRGYGNKSDFLKRTTPFSGTIVTNPPFKYAEEFIVKALELIPDGKFVCMFLKTLYLESQGRGSGLWKDNPPKIVAVHSRRVKCAINGDFEKVKSSSVSYSWFIWEKGVKTEPIIKWIR